MHCTYVQTALNIGCDPFLSRLHFLRERYPYDLLKASKSKDICAVSMQSSGQHRLIYTIPSHIQTDPLFLDNFVALLMTRHHLTTESSTAIVPSGTVERIVSGHETSQWFNAWCGLITQLWVIVPVLGKFLKLKCTLAEAQPFGRLPIWLAIAQRFDGVCFCRCGCKRALIRCRRCSGAQHFCHREITRHMLNIRRIGLLGENK